MWSLSLVEGSKPLVKEVAFATKTDFDSPFDKLRDHSMTVKLMTLIAYFTISNTVNIFVSGDSIVKKKGTNIYVQKICNRSVV